MADRITVIGTLGNDPEERSTNRGPVVQFRLASTERRRDAQGGWSDGPTSWYRVNVWGELGRNALASLRKGQRVIVAGDLSVSEWDAPDGHKGRSVEIRAAALGHDLTFGTSRFERGARPAPPASAPEQAPPPVDRSGEWGVSGLADPPAGAPAPDAEWAPAPF